VPSTARDCLDSLWKTQLDWHLIDGLICWSHLSSVVVPPSIDLALLVDDSTKLGESMDALNVFQPR